MGISLYFYYITLTSIFLLPSSRKLKELLGRAESYSSGNDQGQGFVVKCSSQPKVSKLMGKDTRKDLELALPSQQPDPAFLTSRLTVSTGV